MALCGVIALEHLIKTEFYSIVESLFCGYTDNCLNESQHRTHRILGIAAEDVDYLRGHEQNHVSFLHLFYVLIVLLLYHALFANPLDI